MIVEGTCIYTFASRSISYLTVYLYPVAFRSIIFVCIHIIHDNVKNADDLF